jgi:hypothetical protein
MRLPCVKQPGRRALKPNRAPDAIPTALMAEYCVQRASAGLRRRR